MAVLGTQVKNQECVENTMDNKSGESLSWILRWFIEVGPWMHFRTIICAAMSSTLPNYCPWLRNRALDWSTANSKPIRVYNATFLEKCQLNTDHFRSFDYLELSLSRNFLLFDFFSFHCRYRVSNTIFLLGINSEIGETIDFTSKTFSIGIRKRDLLWNV